MANLLGQYSMIQGGGGELVPSTWLDKLIYNIQNPVGEKSKAPYDYRPKTPRELGIEAKRADVTRRLAEAKAGIARRRGTDSLIGSTIPSTPRLQHMREQGANYLAGTQQTMRGSSPRVVPTAPHYNQDAGANFLAQQKAGMPVGGQTGDLLNTYKARKMAEVKTPTATPTAPTGGLMGGLLTPQALIMGGLGGLLANARGERGAGVKAGLLAMQSGISQKSARDLVKRKDKLFDLEKRKVKATEGYRNARLRASGANASVKQSNADRTAKMKQLGLVQKYLANAQSIPDQVLTPEQLNKVNQAFAIAQKIDPKVTRDDIKAMLFR